MGPPKSELSIIWSAEVLFEVQAIRTSVPIGAGVYRILQSNEYSRYEGRTRILKIGMSDKNLQKEILNHLGRHTVANRLMRVRSHRGVTVSVVFASVPSQDAKQAESELLRQFEDNHWDLPLLNAQRGYARDEDGHYCE